jgi:hypothetical protein
MPWNHIMIRRGWLLMLLDDPFYYPHGVYWPHYRPVRHTYRIVHARAIKYLE